jgi:hypothetical protein
MDSALQILAAFILIDLTLAVAVVVVVILLRRRQAEDERTPLTPLIGALVFLAIISILIYGGVWLCLHSAASMEQ